MHLGREKELFSQTGKEKGGGSYLRGTLLVKIGDIGFVDKKERKVIVGLVR